MDDGGNLTSFDIYVNFTGIPRKYHEGVLLGYRIYFAIAEDIDPCFEAGISFEECSKEMHNSTFNITEITLGAEKFDTALYGLETGTMYTICIAAFTVVGEGPIGDCLQRSTDIGSTHVVLLHF